MIHTYHTLDIEEHKHSSSKGNLDIPFANNYIFLPTTKHH